MAKTLILTDNVVSAIELAYQYGTQQFSSWEGLKDRVYQHVSSDDGWFAIAGAYIAGRMKRIWDCSFRLVKGSVAAHAEFTLVNKGREVNLRFVCDTSDRLMVDPVLLKRAGITTVLNFIMLNPEGLLRMMKVEYLVGTDAYENGHRTKDYMLLDMIIREVLTDLRRMAVNREARREARKQA